MGLRISTNVQSLIAQRNLGSSNAAQQSSLEKLSSGSRINKAADDAAGLAISEKMRSHIRSLNQDIRNANDGISLIQTAEGSMNEIGNILVRFRELSIQGASDTISDTERGFINKEVQQLHSEINRIANSTEFNGTKLLNGEGNLSIQVGLGNNPELDVFNYDVGSATSTTDSLGLGQIDISTRDGARMALEGIDKSIIKLSENRANLGALQNRLESSVNAMSIYRENLSTAKSRIKDLDYAEETANLTRNNILTNAGTSVLSQANQNNLSALRLLQ